MVAVPVLGSPVDTGSPVDAFLRRAHARHLANRDGAVATYIPELARADPEAFGIVIATVDGAVYEVGDTRTPFTIQSIAKPLTYAAILELHGEAAVRRRIGVEPTGDAFNAISPRAGDRDAPQPDGQRRGDRGHRDGPAGRPTSRPERWSAGDGRVDRLVASMGRFAGRPLAVDEAVYRSERDDRPPQPRDRQPAPRHRRHRRRSRGRGRRLLPHSAPSPSTPTTSP